MEQNQNTSLLSLNLDAQNSYTLRSMASWSKVLGWVGMILGILFILAGIMVQQAMSQYGGYRSYRSGGISATAIGNYGLIGYLVLGLIFIVTSIFAINTGGKINAARNYFAFWAVIIIILLLFVLLGILGSLG